jgi:hypothetical protein
MDEANSIQQVLDVQRVHGTIRRFRNTKTTSEVADAMWAWEHSEKYYLYDFDHSKKQKYINQAIAEELMELILLVATWFPEARLDSNMISFSGGICVGKTTLMKLLDSNVSDHAAPVMEEVNEMYRALVQRNTCLLRRLTDGAEQTILRSPLNPTTVLHDRCFIDCIAFAYAHHIMARTLENDKFKNQYGPLALYEPWGLPTESMFHQGEDYNRAMAMERFLKSHA